MEQELQDARAEIERLNQDVKAARSETSAVAKLLAFEPPYQASLAKRVETLLHWKEVTESEIARLRAEVGRKDAALTVAKAAILTQAKLLHIFGNVEESPFIADIDAALDEKAAQ